MTTTSNPRNTSRKPAEDRLHKFELILSGPPDDLRESAWDRLFEAGCGDATIGRTAGVWTAAFTRRAGSLAEAVTSAIRDVEGARVGLSVERVEAGDAEVSTGQVAERACVSRETVRLWATGKLGPGGFPVPSSGGRGRAPTYRWPEVLEWLARNRDRLAREKGRDAEADREADVIDYINARLRLRRLAPRLPEARPAIDRAIKPAARPRAAGRDLP